MNNKYSTYKKDKNFCLLLRIKSPRIVNFILCVINIVLLSFYILLLVSIGLESLKTAVLLTFLFGALLFGSLRLLLWHLYGEELLVVNNKSISYQFNYGVYETKLISIKTTEFQYGFVSEKIEDGQELGFLQFRGNHEETGLPIIIHQTTILLTKDEYQKIVEDIADFFEEEVSFIYSLN